MSSIIGLFSSEAAVCRVVERSKEFMITEERINFILNPKDIHKLLG
jgi:hypothetical protein